MLPTPMPLVPRVFALSLLLSSGALAAPSGPSSVPTGNAVRATGGVVIDGRSDDAVWHTAPVHSEFTQFSPAEGGPARFKTEWQAAFDDRNFYAFVRAYDPEP